MSHENDSPSRRGLKNIQVFNIQGIPVKIKVNLKVYMPSVASILIAKNLRNLKSRDVLDLGTGSGFLAIIASKLGANHVTATDISPRALRLARENAALNGVDNIEFRLGSIYEPVAGDVFDVIICNPPMTPSKTPLRKFTWGGPDGREILDEVIRGAPEHLKKNGRLIVPVISLVGIEKTVKLFQKVKLEPRVLDYDVHEFGKTLLRLKKYLAELSDADFVYNAIGRPCWRLVLFEAIKI